MHQTLIFGQDVAKSEDERRVRDYRLQINDILFLLRFDLGEIGIFWRYFNCRWLEDQKMGSALMTTEGLFLLLASIQAQIIVKGVRKNETATIKTVRMKLLRH